MLEMCRLKQLNDAVTDSEIADMIEKIKSTFKICDPSIDTITDFVEDADLELSARAAVALAKPLHKLVSRWRNIIVRPT